MLYFPANWNLSQLSLFCKQFIIIPIINSEKWIKNLMSFWTHPRPEVIKLHLFPFSLRDIAATWYESLPYGFVDTWEELVEAYLGRFFPPSLTSERRKEIIVFQQGDDESLYVAWKRFKRLLKRCLMHGIDLKTHMDIVYHALNDTSKGIIDASCCGAFK